jgi:hypothetical protein
MKSNFLFFFLLFTFATHAQTWSSDVAQPRAFHFRENDHYELAQQWSTRRLDEITKRGLFSFGEAQWATIVKKNHQVLTDAFLKL